MDLDTVNFEAAPMLISIIAIHGLNPSSVPDHECAWNTWRKPSGDRGRLWLRENLPESAPDAYIFLYGYYSKFVYGGSKELFLNKRISLLEDLHLERTKVSKKCQ